jgi:hypothetical protein
MSVAGGFAGFSALSSGRPPMVMLVSFHHGSNKPDKRTGGKIVVEV